MNKSENKYNPYKLGWVIFAVIFLSTMTIYGFPAVLDDIATWRNHGMDVEDARCAKAFDLEVME